jgi:7-cyano-7-deazaguanine synthase
VEMRKSVVLLSGGIDSMVIAEREFQLGTLAGCVFVDMAHPSQVAEGWKAFSFHGRTKVPLKTIHVFGLDLGDMSDASNFGVVPSRNLVLLSVASNAAASMGGDVLLIGATKSDADEYQDCRADAIAQASDAFIAMGGVAIEAPLVNMTKPEVIAEARALGLTEDDAWSCYRPGPVACGECASCLEASKAWSSK